MKILLFPLQFEREGKGKGREGKEGKEGRKEEKESSQNLQSSETHKRWQRAQESNTIQEPIPHTTSGTEHRTSCLHQPKEFLFPFLHHRDLAL